MNIYYSSVVEVVKTGGIKTGGRFICPKQEGPSPCLDSPCLLSQQRLQKIERLRSDDSKNASAAAYLLLRFALFEVYKINEPVEFEIAPRGKPTLKKYPHIHFNLSHSKGVAACVVADFEVGVDVQSIKSVSSKTAKRVATAQEYKEFLTAESPDDYFCKIWTIKESYVKMTGQGLTTEFRDISAEKIPNIYTFKGNGYYCSTCGSQRFGDETSASVRNIRREDFELLYR